MDKTKPTERPKPMSAAELRRNLAGFEKAIRDQADSFAEMAADAGSGYVRGLTEGHSAAYKQTLVFLHIWTDGEFGDAIGDGA